MKDLKTQLAEAFGRTLPAEPAGAPAQDAEPDALSPDAHLKTPWMTLLRTLSAEPGAPRLAEPPSLGAARMATDQLRKLLAKRGRTREAAEIVRLRDDFLSRRESLAWSRIKARFKAAGLSEKAYRGLKQGDADPVAVFERLARHDDAELASMGAARLKELLSKR